MPSKSQFDCSSAALHIAVMISHFETSGMDGASHGHASGEVHKRVAKQGQIAMAGVAIGPYKERLTDMSTERTRDVPSVYSNWLGKAVVLLVVLRQCHVPLPCSIVGESASNVRVRIHPGWELDVRKELILAIEEDALGMAGWIN
jgi:hypothetical protein